MTTDRHLALFEPDLRANAPRLSQQKTGIFRIMLWDPSLECDLANLRQGLGLIDLSGAPTITTMHMP
jgi:hypothetical protein